MGKGAGKGASGGGDVPDLGMPYLEQTAQIIISARVGWLSVFFAGLLLTMVIMESFEETLSENVELSFFVPLIVGHAGNTGSQAVSTVIRALALGEATLGDSIHITTKEFITGGVIGICLGVFSYPLGVYISGLPLRVMFSVAVSLPAVSCVANLIGAGLPLCCEKLQLDPAVIAAPMMTTMVDCSGILTYLIISGFVIGHPTEEHLEAMEAHLEREIEEQFGVAPCAGLLEGGDAARPPKEPREGAAPPPPPPPTEEEIAAIMSAHPDWEIDEVTGMPHPHVAREGDDTIGVFMNVCLVATLCVMGYTFYKQRTAEEEDPPPHDEEEGGNKLTPRTQAFVEGEGGDDEVQTADLGPAPVEKMVSTSELAGYFQEALSSLTAKGDLTTAGADAEVNAGKLIVALADRCGVELVLHSETYSHMRMLQTVPLLKAMSAEELKKIASNLEVCRYAPGEKVITEGNTDQAMFVVASGTAVCTKEGVNDGNPIMNYSAGDFFGERALLADEPRAATIAADSALVVLMVDRSTYKMILDSKNAVTEQIDQLQQYYQKTTGTTLARDRAGGLGGVGGPSVSDAFKGMRSIWRGGAEGPAASESEPADNVDNPSHGAANGQAAEGGEAAPAPDADV